MSALRPFRRLAEGAAAATFALIVLGGIVRVSDSGLGCGAAGSGMRGWPLCGGRVVPLVQTNALIEYAHRAVAALVVGLLVALAWLAVRRLRDRPRLGRGALAACLLVLAQAVLGALTVEHGLEEALVAAHLGVAMLLLGLLIALSLEARGGERGAAGAPAGRLTRTLAATGAALVLATIVAGGVVAGSERHGTPAGNPGGGAHMACGKEFPTCNGALLPFGAGSDVDIQLVHRSLMALATLTLAAFALIAWRRRAHRRLALLVAGLLFAQVLLGALNVWLGEHAELVVAHLALGTLLWAASAGAALALQPDPGRLLGQAGRRRAQIAAAEGSGA